MNTVCKENACTGCMACIDICPKHAITIKDDLVSYNAVIDVDLCVNCNLCHKVCQNNKTIKLTQPILWQQGWTNDEDIRLSSSSGGLATEISKAFVGNGGIVYSCVFRNGNFVFEKAETVGEVKKFKGSKYVKSNPAGVYKSVLADLKQNKKVLFIGLPCQVGAIKEYAGENLQGNLYTIDLICHGTPSPQLLNKFLLENKIDIEKVQAIAFRYKINDKTDKKIVKSFRYVDRYSIAFLDGLNYTENCYQCKYAGNERIGDITLGDSWGTDLPLEERGKGVSLILCQNEKGKALLAMPDLYLTDVNIEKAKEWNQTLNLPTVKNEKRDEFFMLINSGATFNKAVKKCLSRSCTTQTVKMILQKLHIYNPKGKEGIKFKLDICQNNKKNSTQGENI